MSKKNGFLKNLKALFHKHKIYETVVGDKFLKFCSKCDYEEVIYRCYDTTIILRDEEKEYNVPERIVTLKDVERAVFSTTPSKLFLMRNTTGLVEFFLDTFENVQQLQEELNKKSVIGIRISIRGDLADKNRLEFYTTHDIG